MPLLKTLTGLIFSLWFGAFSASATTVFTSPYYGQNPGSANDQDGVIGLNAQFDIQSVVFTNITPSNVTVQIDFNYNYGDIKLSPFTVDGINLQAADLLFTSGSDMWGIALSSHPGFMAGDLYSVDDFLTAKQVLGNPAASYNPNDVVWMNNDGNQRLAGTGTVSTVGIGGDEVQTTLSFTPPANLLSAFNVANVLFDFGSATCANDYINGTVGAITSVPEPTSFILLGAGLVGLGFIRRRRS
jgi:hypothetical protein